MGANNPCSPTSRSKKTGNTVALIVEAGGFSGDEYLDSLGLEGDVFTQRIGVAQNSTVHRDLY